MKPETIFVKIPSYRDPDCQHTIKDLFEKAACPERITAGVVWQIDAEKDQHCFEVPYPYPERVRQITVDYRESEGLGWARSKAMELYQGQDYILQIDAHMRFYPGWDDALIAELAALRAKGVEKPVISMWSVGIPPKGEPIWAQTYSLSAYIEGHTFRPVPKLYFPINEPAPMAFSSGHMLFAPARFFAEVPNDPYIIFTFDEFNTSLRGWTHGWDIFMLPSQVVAHRFFENSDKTHVRVWDDNPELVRKFDIGTRRYRHLVGIEKSDDPEVTRGLDRYGLGTRRTLRSFVQFSGLDLHKNATELFTDMGLVDPQRILPETLGRFTPFDPHARTALTGRCAQQLRQWIQSSEIRSILDIGCLAADLAGPCQGLQTYTGMHTEEAVLSQMAEIHENDCRYLFMQLYPKVRRLPPADLVVVDAGCMCAQDCWYILDLLKQSKPEYLLAPYQVHAGMLCAQPFLFPEPDHIFSCGERLLGLWRADRHLRRFFYKEPAHIRNIRTPLTMQLVCDLKYLHAGLGDDKKMADYLHLFAKSPKEHNNLLTKNGMKFDLAACDLLHVHHQVYRMRYMGGQYDRLSPPYSRFITPDKHIRYIQRYLVEEAIYDYALQMNFPFQFEIGNPENRRKYYPVGRI